MNWKQAFAIGSIAPLLTPYLSMSEVKQYAL